ncbi:MAG: hypothetical protein ABS871_07425 [Methanobrevibacter sp.]
MNKIISKIKLKSIDEAIFEAVDVPVLLEPEPNGKIELKADIIPIKNVNIIPHIENTTAYTLATYTRKFGITYDLSRQANVKVFRTSSPRQFRSR